MDFSINNIKATNKNINFKGMEGAYSIKNTPVFKFIAPPHSKDEKVFLEFVFLHPDEKTDGYKKPKIEHINSLPFKTDDTLQVSQKAFRDVSSGFAYRYRIEDKDGKFLRYEVDSFKTIGLAGEIDENGLIVNSDKMNVIEQGRFYGVSPKGGSMRHSFLDSDVVLKTSQDGIDIKKDFVRNHFNKIGGNIKGLTWLLKNTNELDNYGYCMTTPDISDDQISSHGYWPANHYQCSNLDDFKEFVFELFKKGKGYVADGAFTSQGLQSPLVQHVLKWGKKSPYYNMLKIDPNSTLSLGVLPDMTSEETKEVYKHIGVRVVNKKGTAEYDENKPTYIQFYDDRLLEETSQVDGKLHFTYDKAPADHYEITTHQDSVQPYAFEVDANDAKLKVFKNKNAVLLTELDAVDDFLTFPNYRIVAKNKVGGATFWDGNVDIIKMNLSNPDRQNPANVKGFIDARDYLYGVASYWAETFQSHLILESAKLPEEELKKVAEANGVDNERFGKIKNVLSKLESMVLGEDKKTAKDYVAEFPLQSLETSEELSAIFAQKEFTKALLTPETSEKVLKIFNDTIEGAIPAQFKGNEDYRTYVEKTYGVEILRHIYASALNPDAVSGGKIDIEKLKQVTLKSLESHKSIDPQDEVKQVVSKIKAGLSDKSTATLQDRMKKELSGISLDKFKLAEAVVIQGKGGLNWRFDAAKDIGDLDAVRDKKAQLDIIFNGEKYNPGIMDFFDRFIANIRKYNKAPYIINELTAMGEFTSFPDGTWEDADFAEKVYRPFDAKMTEAWIQAGRPTKYEERPVYLQQVNFINKTNSTTVSEYAKGFNAFSKFAGVDPEWGSDVSGQAGNLCELKNAMEELMIYNQPNAAIYSHMFYNNHDKPTVMHCFPLDMSVFLSGDLSKLKDTKQIIELTGRKDLDKLCPKAVAVGLAMRKTIDELYPDVKDDAKATKKNKTIREKLYKSLENLVNGKKDANSAPSFKRAESFGVKPYEITIRDVLKGADMDSEDNLLNFHSTMLKDAMIYNERLWQVMNACVGIPTLYGGGEFAQTGYESSSKNMYLGIRNQIQHQLKDDPRYKPYYTKMQETSGLYQNPGLSALRNGAPISCEAIGDTLPIKKELSELNKKYATKEINDGALGYFVGQIQNYLKEKDAMSVEELFKELAKLSSNTEALNKFLKDTLKIDSDANNKNHETFAKNIEIVRQTLDEKIVLDEKLENADKTIIWPVFKKDSTGSQTLSIVTNLGLPYGEASFKDSESAKEIKPHKIITGSIELKDKNGRCPVYIPEGYELRRFGAPNEIFEIVEGCLKPKNGEFFLKDTVTTFYLAKKALKTAM
ncbi:MAG: hypothetical protein E7Z88_00685 [Cyanobacteria bacterium SIG27]|nr:hypothetical protein [Cyanobacteria bacterium SIG27]